MTCLLAPSALQLELVHVILPTPLGRLGRMTLWRAVLLCMLLSALQRSTSSLQFKEDGTFKIIQFTDLHFGEADDKDARTQMVMRTVLRAEHDADLVVLSGDMVSGYAWDRSQGWFQAAWRKVLQPLEEAGIPYAAVLGNHDDTADLARREIVALDAASSKLSLTRQGPADVTGASNYLLSIRASSAGGSSSSRHGGDGSSNDDDVAARIWMLDSMDRGCYYIPIGWGCVGRDTLQWVAESASALTHVPSLAFIHIPIPQFMKVWRDSPTHGSKEETVNCPFLDGTTVVTLRDAGVTAVYSGHDHNNDYLGPLEGMRLAYGRKSGYGSYGPPGGWLRGARIITLREGHDPGLSDTYLRLEDGTAVQQASSIKDPNAVQQYFCRPVFFLELVDATWRLRQCLESEGPQFSSSPDTTGFLAMASTSHTLFQRCLAEQQGVRLQPGVLRGKGITPADGRI